MNMPLPHRIRRLSWQARAPTPAAGLDLRQLLRSSIEPVHNTLEEIIALALPPGQTLRLPRLTVHVHLEEDADETRLLEQLRKAFQSALADLGVAFLTSHDSPEVPGISPASSPGLPDPLERFPLTRSAPETGDAETIMVVARTLAERMDSDPAALSQALNNALHGQSTPPPLTGQARILLVGQALDLPAAWLPPLIAQTRRRLGHPAAQPSHHSPPSLPADQDLQLQHSLARYLATGSVDWSLAGLPRKQVLAWLQDAAHLWTTLGVPPPLTGLSVRERTGAMARWLDLLDAPTQRTLMEAHPLPPSATPAETHLFALAQAGGSRSDTVAARALWLLWRGSAEVATGTPAPELAAWLTETAPCLPPALEASLKPHASGHQCFSSTGVTGNGTPQAFIPSPSTRPSPLLESPAPGVRVPHAGLVLLHPWLARLLNATGMHPLGQNGPLATHSLPGAATLLHWLATGQIDCHEFELPFVKLLLGHGPDEPLAFPPPALAPSQQMEGQALLEAALGHWKALGSTAIDSLRSAFLQRPGSLIQQDEAWQLRVDTESFDMLLGLLPWGFGLVRLPWMRTPLRVEWEPPR